MSVWILLSQPRLRPWHQSKILHLAAQSIVAGMHPAVSDLEQGKWGVGVWSTIPSLLNI